MTTPDDKQQKHWYQYPLVWMMISIPLTSVILGISLLTLAINTDDSMVVSNYYQKGKMINLVLARDRYASALGLTARLTFNSDVTTVTIKLNSKVKLPPAPIALRLYHPTRKTYDKTIILKTSTQSQNKIQTYRASFPALRKGKWYLQLDTRRWRIVAEAILPSSSAIQLKPSL